jgi:hypothetical protein
MRPGESEDLEFWLVREIFSIKTPVNKMGWHSYFDWRFVPQDPPIDGTSGPCIRHICAGARQYLPAFLSTRISSGVLNLSIILTPRAAIYCWRVHPAFHGDAGFFGRIFSTQSHARISCAAQPVHRKEGRATRSAPVILMYLWETDWHGALPLNRSIKGGDR